MGKRKLIIDGEVELVGSVGQSPVLKPRVTVPVGNVTGLRRGINFTVDTGFTGWLTLPLSVIRELDLGYRATSQYLLANDEVSQSDLYLAFVAHVPVIVHQLDAEPLLGAAMMNECRLTVDFWEGGTVAIVPRTELV